MSDGRLFVTDKRAVTPVVSTILMVAIVVVLGAVISVTALGMANDILSPAPQVSFDYSADYTNGDVIITQTAGGTLNGDQLRFSGAALEKTTYRDITEWAGKDVKSGDSAAVHVARGETLKLIWRSSNRRNTATIAEYDVPNDLGPTASIGSVETGYSTYTLDGDLTVKKIQFSQVQDNNVYVVVEAARYSDNKIFSNSGGDLDMELNPGGGVHYLKNDDPVTVTVYETKSKSNVLTTVTVPA